MVALATLASTFVACGDDEAGGGPGSGGSAASGGSGASGGAGATGGTGAGGAGGEGATGGTGAGPSSPACDPLPPPSGNVIELGPSDDVPGAVAAAPAGSTIVLADGTYELGGQAIWINAEGVTLRSQSGDASAVVLDGGYDTPSGGLVNVGSVSGVTIAELTIQRPRYHCIHVTASDAAANDTRIYGVRAIDPGEQAIKINHASQGFYADFGEVACSTIELTPAGREQVMSYSSSGSSCYTGGVDAHGAEGWVVRDNFIRGFWCSNGDLSEHGIHFWTGSRDTLVERNVLVDNARGIGFGLTDGGRTYGDDPCPGVSDASHYGGVIRNNFIAATDDGLFASPNGMDGGIALAYACDATVAHNTVASDDAPFASIEWRFGKTDVHLVNNLVTHNLMERDGATATAEGNLENAPASDVVDLASGDLHLTPSATAQGAGAPAGAALAETDIDGDMRASAPDVGADESP